MEPREITPPPIPRIQSYQARLKEDFKPTEGGPHWISALEGVLKHPAQLVHDISKGKKGWMPYLMATFLAGTLLYGFVMGTYSGGTQLWAAPVKFAFGFFMSALLTFPSLYIFTCVNGADLKIKTVFFLLLLSMSLTVVLLIGFAPVAWIFSQTTNNLPLMGWIHLILWITSVGFGLRLLSSAFGLLARDFTGGLVAWVFVFLLVCFQMSAVLRPLLGTSKLFLSDEKVFFLSYWFSCMGGE